MDRKGGKKGQVTLFIIIAILIVAAGIASYFIYQKSIETRQLSREAKVANAKNYVSEKVKEISEGDLALTYLQGGFIDPATYILTVRNTKIPLYLIKNNISQPNIPTVDFLENALEDKIKKDIEKIDLKNLSYVSSLSVEDVTIELDKDSNLNVKYTILIDEDDFSTIIVEEYKGTWLLNFEKMLGISKNITKSHELMGLEINMLNLEGISKENNVTISVDIVDPMTLVYAISDKNPEGGMFYIAIKNET